MTEKVKYTDKELIKIAERKYAKEWRDKNPDKVKKNRDRHYLKKALSMLENGEL